MRILHVLGHVGRLVHDPDQHAMAGIGNAALQIAAAQVKLGHQVTVCGFSEPQPTGTGSWRGVKIVTLTRAKWARLTTRLDAALLWPLFLQTLKTHPVDVLHIHELGLLHLPLSKARVMHIHVPFSEKTCKSHLWKKADAVVCVSKHVRESFLKSSAYASERTFVVYNGAAAASLSETEVKELRESLGVSSDKIAIFFAGALVHNKGPDVLLRALQELIARYTQMNGRIKVLIAGGSDLWRVQDQDADHFFKELRSLADGLDAAFLGMLPHDKVLALYQASDIPVVPSVFQEPHPLAVCEAMAAGKPVVASNVGGIPETIIDGQTGILFSPGDHVSLAGILKQLIENPMQRSQMGLAAKERAKDFTWQSSAMKLNGIYTALL
jgi:glycosyltransferase involved in cell wall biosynthesis